jgi:uncharacterized membrane protein
MEWLAVGLIVFFSVHLVPTIVPLRRRLAAWKGEGVYQLGFSLIAAAGLLQVGCAVHRRV